jgi:hypothetical protein
MMAFWCSLRMTRSTSGRPLRTLSPRTITTSSWRTSRHMLKQRVPEAQRNTTVWTKCFWTQTSLALTVLNLGRSRDQIFGRNYCIVCKELQPDGCAGVKRYLDEHLAKGSFDPDSQFVPCCSPGSTGTETWRGTSTTGRWTRSLLRTVTQSRWWERLWIVYSKPRFSRNLTSFMPLIEGREWLTAFNIRDGQFSYLIKR